MTTATPSDAFREVQLRNAEGLRFIGIDPGIVHTAAVMLVIRPLSRTVVTVNLVVDGIKPAELDKMIRWVNSNPLVDRVFIEKYRPRSNSTTTWT